MLAWLMLLSIGNHGDPLRITCGCQKVESQNESPISVEEESSQQYPQKEQADMFSSPLERAITRGMRSGGDLAEELADLDDYSIRSRKDAKAICNALRNLSLDTSSEQCFTSPLYSLTVLFQHVDGREAPAFDVLYNEGLSQLIRILDVKLKTATDEDADDLLFVLKILAMYRSRVGAEKIIEVAKRPLKPDAYMWHVILSTFSGKHPCRDYVFQELSNPLPPDFLAVALLDSANKAVIEGDLKQHPFDSPEGHERLQNWLEDIDPESFSYAHSATASLPFMSNPTRDRLLALAMDHVDTSVQMEAAWAAGRLGRKAGLKILARYCLDVNHSEEAQHYLTELGRQEFIPTEVKEPSFQAKADFAHWLAHPNELGQPPDELEIVDHRDLAWPPERKKIPFWLIRYRLCDHTGLEDDDIDCGLVGSMTWCFFSYKVHQRPPEDAYAIHCCWEMEHGDLIEETEAVKPAEYKGMLKQWQGKPIDNLRITRVMELSPKLKYPTRLVCLATGNLEGKEGWVVLDGPRSTWYPKEEQPAETCESVVWKIHIGRQLLGFHDKPNRKKYIISDHPKRDPQQVVAAYEKLLADAENAEPKQQQEMLESGPLSRHFDAYIEALATVNGTSKVNVIIGVYERFLRLAEQSNESIRSEIYDSISVLGEHFDAYVDALVSNGQTDTVSRMIKLFDPYWDHNSGYSKLGTAAYNAGQRDVAEQYFIKLYEGMKDYCRMKEMSLMAEIWHNRGESELARKLLIDCMRGLVKLIEDSKYNCDRKMFADEFQHHRSTFLRLFADGESDLCKLGITESPLQ